MYKKLPNTLFQHAHSKFEVPSGYCNDGLLIFTSEEIAKTYNATDENLFDEELMAAPSKAYKKISKDELLTMLEEKKDEVNGGGKPYTVIFNLDVQEGKGIKYAAVYTYKELLNLLENNDGFCSGHSEDYHPEHFQGLIDQFDFQGELTDILDGYTQTDFDQQMINEIVLWKVNRYVTTKSENHWLALLNTFKDDKELDPDKLRHFLEMVLPNKTRGIRLAMASTFLRFRNPEIYQIIDERTFRVVMKGEGERPKLASYSKIEDQIELYIKYLKKLKEFCEDKNISFRDSDRILYQFDIIKNGDFN